MSVDISNVRDRSWVKNSMLAKSAQARMLHKHATTFTSASVKFTDTRLGGSLVINPPPQFTRSCDPKEPGLATDGYGQGIYYTEAIEEHSQRINVRLGVPSFNNLALYLANFYDSGAGAMARAGRSGGVLGIIHAGSKFVVTVMTWKFQALAAVGNMFRFFAGIETSRFYTVKHTMPNYWAAVQSMVNQLTTYMGITPRVLGEDASNGPNQGYKFDGEEAKRFAAMMPGTFRENGNIDVFAVANRAQRLIRKQMKIIDGMMNDSVDDIASALSSANRMRLADEMPSYDNYMKSWLKQQAVQAGNASSPAIESLDDLKKQPDSFEEYLKAELDDGGQWVSFRVNQTGSASESFSNQTGESEFASKLSSISSSARTASFAFKGGIMPGVDQVIGAVGAAISGALDAVKLGGGLALATGSTNAIIPEQWQGSSATLNETTYTVDLVSPYNHPIYQLMYIYVPLCMLLAMALPLANGKQSYSSPFLLEYYDKGRAQSRLAICKSMSITRGIHSMPFNFDNRAMGIQVSFTLADLSPIMFMPISMENSLLETAGTVLGTAAIASGIGGAAMAATQLSKGFFDDNNNFSDYMAVLSSLGLADQIYPMRKLKLNMTREMLKWDMWTSPARMASFMGDSLPGRVASIFFGGIARQ